MRLGLFVYGKLKTPGLREAADYYQRLIKTWTPIEETELKPFPVPEKHPKIRAQIQDKEGRQLLERLSSSKAEASGRNRVFLLDETGKTKSTLDWANWIKSWEIESVPSVTFCIGSSLGFSNEVRQHSSGLISLSPQTLSHELARVVLLEQLYRALSVVKGHPYHNEGS